MSDPQILPEIVAATRDRAAGLDGKERELRTAAAAAPAIRSIATALTRPGLQVIAEIKRRSPSAGMLAKGLDPAAQAASYQEGGAAAISVLTEPHFFDGSAADLEAAREAVELPLLRKDFVVDPLQVWESRAMGADAVLLIVAILSYGELVACLAAAHAAGIEALVEAHSPDEARTAVGAGAHIVGVNNRDLRTFVTDLTVAERIRPLLGPGVIAVAESGVSEPEDAARMMAAGYDAILVGEALVRAKDPTALIARLRGTQT